jgi:hypothetical protein
MTQNKSLTKTIFVLSNTFFNILKKSKMLTIKSFRYFDELFLIKCDALRYNNMAFSHEYLKPSLVKI